MGPGECNPVNIDLEPFWTRASVAPSGGPRCADADPSRSGGVSILGVDEHVWHHVSTKPIADGGREPRELTGMVDPTQDE
jgi:hypothetical protein